MPATAGARDAFSPDGPPARGKGCRPRPRKVERLYPSWTAPARDSFHCYQSSFEKGVGEVIARPCIDEVCCDSHVIKIMHVQKTQGTRFQSNYSDPDCCCQSQK